MRAEGSWFTSSSNTTRGVSTNIHRAVDGQALAMRIPLTPAQAGDNPQVPLLLDPIRVDATRQRRPRARPHQEIACKQGPFP